MKTDKEEEFLTLKQNYMTVGQYTAKFEELSQFYQQDSMHRMTIGRERGISTKFELVCLHQL